MRSSFLILGGFLLGIGVPGPTSAVAQAAKPPVMKHALKGRERCLMCHSGKMAGIPALPESHADRTVETCGWCHLPDAAMQKVEAQPMSHGLEGHAECLSCHGIGAKEDVQDVPDDHQDRKDSQCMMCHAAAKTGSGT